MSSVVSEIRKSVSIRIRKNVENTTLKISNESHKDNWISTKRKPNIQEQIRIKDLELQQKNKIVKCLKLIVIKSQIERILYCVRSQRRTYHNSYAFKITGEPFAVKTLHDTLTGQKEL